MKISVSGYYAWRKRLTEPPCVKRKRLADLITACYWENRKRYGARRIRAALAKSGVKVGRFQVRSIMREQGLKAMQPRSFQPRTTDSRGTAPAPNLLAQVKPGECAAAKIIVGDITYLPLRSGKWCYLAVWRGQGDQKNCRLEYQRFNECRISYFSFAKGDSQRSSQSRSDNSFGQRQSICGERFSLIATNKLFSPKYERQRQLL